MINIKQPFSNWYFNCFQFLIINLFVDMWNSFSILGKFKIIIWKFYNDHLSIRNLGTRIAFYTIDWYLFVNKHIDSVMLRYLLQEKTPHKNSSIFNISFLDNKYISVRRSRCSVNKNDIFGLSVVVSVGISRDRKFNVREQIGSHRIRTRAANRARFSIVARSDHLARPGQKMLTLVRFDLQDSSMLKNFNICFYHKCIDTLCYIINHNIATWSNFSFIRHDDYSTRICIQMPERKDIDMTNSEGKQRKIKCPSYKMGKIFEMSLNERMNIKKRKKLVHNQW